MILLCASLLFLSCSEDNPVKGDPESDKIQDNSINGTWELVSDSGDIDTAVFLEEELTSPGAGSGITGDHTVGEGEVKVGGSVVAVYIISDDTLYIQEGTGSLVQDSAFAYIKLTTGDTGDTTDDTITGDHPGMDIPKGTAVEYDSSLYTEGMVLIESKGESFDMGVRDSSTYMDFAAIPVHEVGFTYDYYMDSKEVTIEEFSEILNYAKSVVGVWVITDSADFRPGAYYRLESDEDSLLLLVDLSSPQRTIKFSSSEWFHNWTAVSNRAVTSVTWYAAALYCNMLSRKRGLEQVYDVESFSYHNTECIDYTANGYRLPTEAEWEYAARGGGEIPLTSGVITMGTTSPMHIYSMTQDPVM